MKLKIFTITFLLCISILVSFASAGESRAVSITEGGNQFISVPDNMPVTYLYMSSTPQNGRLLLSIGNSDTYMVNDGITIQMITVNKNESMSIIDTILGWLPI